MRSTELMSRSMAPLAMAALLILSACGEKKADEVAVNATTSADSAAIRDSAARAPMGDSAPSVEVVPPAPEPVEVPPAPAAVVARPKPASRPAARPTSKPATPPAAAPSAPAEPARASGTVAAGTTIAVTSGAKVCSNTLQVGDRVTATTNAPISASNGVSIPAGARVGLVVTASKTSSNQTDDAELAFDVRTITFGGETYTMSGAVSTDAVVKERKGGDGKKVAIGAAAGAVIGNVIGGGSRAQRTVVGAAAGGLAGAAAAAMTGDRFACLPEGAALSVRVGSPLTVRN